GRRGRGAHLSQAAGAPDLARRRRDGVRRCALALRPPPAGGRAEARQGQEQGQDRVAACRVGAKEPMRIATFIRVLVAAAALAAATPGFAVRPDEILPDPKLEARARALS